MPAIYILPKEPGGKAVPVELRSPIYAFDGVDYLGLFARDNEVIYLRFCAGLNNRTYSTGLADKCAPFEKVDFAALIKGESFGRLCRIPAAEWHNQWRAFKRDMHLIKTV